MDAAEMWKEVVRDLHQGLPGEGDKGLDNTHTWGRTYWGGALFCLLADVEIHRQTGNRKGLEDALRGILDAGGNITQDWPLEKALDIGDRATGVAVLRPLYDKMKDQPYNVDLPALWAQLGIVQEGEKVRFVNDAPLAKTREAITYGSASASLGAAVAPPAFSAFAGRTRKSQLGN
jgi:predicted metalloprotease with PDZ domain